MMVALTVELLDGDAAQGGAVSWLTSHTYGGFAVRLGFARKLSGVIVGLVNDRGAMDRVPGDKE
jgi:hypothetical protein